MQRQDLARVKEELEKKSEAAATYDSKVQTIWSQGVLSLKWQDFGHFVIDLSWLWARR
jgi:hypothetical protein